MDCTNHDLVGSDYGSIRFSRCLRVPIAMRRFYKPSLRIPQHFSVHDSESWMRTVAVCELYARSE